MVWEKLETYLWEPLKRNVRWRQADCPGRGAEFPVETVSQAFYHVVLK